VCLFQRGFSSFLSLWCAIPTSCTSVPVPRRSHLRHYYIPFEDTMPSLVLFGRRTFMAGDDLRFFAAFAFLFRLLQLGLTTAIVAFVIKSTSGESSSSSGTGGWIVEQQCLRNGGVNRITENLPGFGYAYSAMSLVLALSGLYSCVLIFRYSGKGTPTDNEPRRSTLRRVCHINLTAINVLRITTCIFGFIVVFCLEDYCSCLIPRYETSTVVDGDDPCPDVVWTFVLCILIVTHSLDAVYAVLAILYFGGCHLFNYVPVKARPTMTAQNQWHACCTCFCGLSSLLTCCIFGGSEAIGTGDFADFALVMTDYFNHNDILDVTPSDIIAGLLMVRRLQKQEQFDCRDRLLAEIKHDQQQIAKQDEEGVVVAEEEQVMIEVSDEQMQRVQQKVVTPVTGSERALQEEDWNTPMFRETLSVKNPRDRLLIAEGARYISIAQAIYTWFSYLLEYPATGVCSLACKTALACACCHPSRHAEKIQHDYCCQCNTVSFKSISGLEESDIVHIEYQSGVEATPYVIALDHEWKSVVLAIRGTQSLEDMLADITLHPEELNELGEECGFDGSGQFCHAGMLACAVWIYRDLQRCDGLCLDV
jgi:hypothetical protein